MSRAGGALTMTLATLALALLLRAPLAGGPDQRLPTGIYHGWVGAAGGRFQLVGRPCDVGDPVQALELLGSSGGPRQLTGADVSSQAADVDFGREVTVTSFSAAALRRVSDGGTAPVRPGRADHDHHPDRADHERRADRASRSSPVLSFTRLKARCRSWREVDADIGHAAVALVTDQVNGRAANFEAHVVPVPDRTSILALLLLWNRSSKPVTVSAVSYAPEPATTDRVLAAVGSFEQYREWEDYLFGRPSATRPPPATLGGGRPEAAAGPSLIATDPPSALPTTMNAADLDLPIAAGGIALIAFDRNSFRRAGAASTLLSYPVVDYLVGGASRQLGLTTPLYSTSLRSSPSLALRAVLHSLFAASSPVGPAALLDEDLLDED